MTIVPAAPAAAPTAPRAVAAPAASPAATREAAVGLAYALSAFLLWGVAPIYFKQLGHVSAWEVVAHRTLWSFVGLGLILLIGFRRQAREGLRLVVTHARVARDQMLLTGLIGFNWTLFMWAVLDGRIVETSLGYFMNPLVVVALGVLVLGERLRRGQWVAIALGMIGVAVAVVAVGTVPWVSLALAVSFGFYTLVRKRSRLTPLTSLFMETLLLLPVALAAVLWFEASGHGALGTGDWATWLLLAGAGAVTATPLVLHMAATRRLSLTTMGLAQYLAPSISLVIGVVRYDEAFGWDRQVMFACIWAGLALYTAEGLRHRARQRPARAVAADRDGAADAERSPPGAATLARR